jgi:hypothetical protein
MANGGIYMIRKRVRLLAICAVIAVAIYGLLSVSGVLGAGGGDSALQAARLNNPTYVACERSAKPVCNPQAWSTLVASNPVAHEPSAQPQYVSRASAIALALKVPDNGLSHAASSEAEIRAQMMSMPDYERLEGQGHDFVTNPHRLLWVVTVHAPLDIQVGAGIKQYDVYTLVIDAQTGSAFHMCTCEALH